MRYRPSLAGWRTRLVLLATAALPARVRAQLPSPHHRLGQEQAVTASDSAPRFGTTVALDGDQAVVGAHWADPAGPQSGQAYVFRDDGTTWTEQQVLLPGDVTQGDQFGWSVAMHEDLLVVGARRQDGATTDAGAAYVYRWNGGVWQQEQKLLPSDPQAQAEFGTAVSVDDDLVVVGAWQTADAGTNSGAAYAFRWSGTSWVQEHKLQATDASAGACFGAAVAVQGDAVVIGAVLDQGKGAAYVFRFDGSAWSEEQKLTHAGLQANDQFGQCVSLDQDVVVVGAWLDDALASDAGAAFVYRYAGGTWVLESRLDPRRPEPGDRFGGAVSVRDGLLLVGAKHGGPGLVPGTVTLFRFDGADWVPHQELQPEGGGQDFGAAVAAGRDAVLVGDPLGDRASFFRVDADACRYRYEQGTLALPVAVSGGSLAADKDRVLECVPASGARVHQRVQGTWVLEQDITPANPGKGFGAAAALAMPVAAVGAPEAGSRTGRVRVFRRTTTWTDEGILLAGDRATQDEFGRAMAARSDTLAIGAPYHDHVAGNAGAVYLFAFDGNQWSEVQELNASDGAASDTFGSSVALDQDLLVVGAPGARQAYVFREVGGAWVEEQILVPTGASYLTGEFVSVQGNVIAVGNGSSVAMFRWSGAGWVEEQILSSTLQPTFLTGAVRTDRFTTDRVGFWYDGSQWEERWEWIPERLPAVVPATSAVAVADPEIFVLDSRNAALRWFEPTPVLDVTPQPVEVGETLTLRLCDGMVGTPGLIAVVDLGGTPGFWIVHRGTFAADATITQRAPVPPALAGLGTWWAGLGFDREGRLALTPLVGVDFRDPGPR